MLSDYGISFNQPLYLYQKPMFLITVSAVLFSENGAILVKEDNINRFAGGIVKAGQETIQFAAIRHIKEQTGITLKKETIIPVDFRSSPERSKEGNVVDIGMLVNLDGGLKDKGFWAEVDFENKKLVKKIELYMDHEILLERAIEILLMLK